MPRPTDKRRKPPDWIAVSRLLLDKYNCRLPEDTHGASQQELFQILDKDFELLPIGESLADNGYFLEEPLVGIPAERDQFTIVEGNRRLAALKLLTEPKLRKLALNQRAWEDLAAQATENLSEAPVLVYQNRDELTSFLGYRHIAGILKWDPLAKGRFIAGIVDKKGKGADFREAARETGSKANTIRDNYIAYRILLQAREGFEIDTSKLEKNFSVFYRALGNPSITRFIGLTKDKPPRELRQPVPVRKAKTLEELIGYIHGINNTQPVVTDSRQLTMLGEVLENKVAYDHLRVNRSLLRAHELTGGEERRLIDNLDRASFYLDEALRDVHRHRRSPKVAQPLRRCAQTIAEILKHFPQVTQELEEAR